VLGKKMESVPEVFLTSPTLMNVTVFARTLGHWGGFRQGIGELEHHRQPVIANFGQQARSELGPGARQRTEQIMIGMRGEKLLDTPPIEAQLFFDCKKHLH
jgi:hypothetical protein